MAVAELFTALADPTRRQIYESLRDHPKSVGELAESQPVSRPAVSQHLRVLEAASLVTVEPQGNRRMYSIRREGLDVLRQYVDSFCSGTLSAFADEVKRRKKKKA